MRLVSPGAACRFAKRKRRVGYAVSVYALLVAGAGHVIPTAVSRWSRAAPRRGIVLLVVISLLTIFAVAGLAFVYYADAEATASKYNREGTVFKQPDEDPEMLFAYVLQQLLFDMGDDTSAATRPSRASIFRNMYGYNPAPPTAPSRWHPTRRLTSALAGSAKRSPIPCSTAASR